MIFAKIFEKNDMKYALDCTRNGSVDPEYNSMCSPKVTNIIKVYHLF